MQRACKLLPSRCRQSAARTICCLLFLTVVHSTRAQDNIGNVAVADFVNRVFVSPPVIPGITNISGITNQIQAASVAVFGGIVRTNDAQPIPADTNRQVFLRSCGFGQAVETSVAVVPDFKFGESITNPPGFFRSGTPNPPAFVAADDKLYAGGSGFVTIVWSNASIFRTNRYLISSVPARPPVRIYWTHQGREETGAPKVDVNGLTVVPRYNSAISGSELALNGNLLTAQSKVGLVMLEYRDSSNAFVGLEIVDVREYKRDYSLTADVGQYLTPVDTIGLDTPFVSHGSNDAPPYVYRNDMGLDTNYGRVFAVRPTTVGAPPEVELFWLRPGLQNVIWPYEANGYRISWPSDEGIFQRIYHTERGDGSSTKAPIVHISGDAAPRVTVHRNPIIGTNLWLEPTTRQLHATEFSDPFPSVPALIHYDDPAQGRFIGIEYVNVVPYSPDLVDEKDIGDQLPPPIDALPTPFVTRGLQGQVGDPFIYRHSADGPMKDHVFAIKTTASELNIEIFWKRLGLRGVEWPYRMHRYLADWPTDTDKYQLYVRGDPPVLGPSVEIPPEFNAQRMDFQEPLNHAREVSNHRFFAEGPGWSLLKYTPSNAVYFQVVQSVLHTDSRFDLSRISTDIGTEIHHDSHEGPRPGFIYVPQGDRYDWEIYDGSTNDPPEFRTGQIFAVNTGPLEVWWSKLRMGVQWPSLVKRYNAGWPEPPREKIIIASQQGSGPITSAEHRNYRLYFQNERNFAGFNPNDEHAFFFIPNGAEAGADFALFALRDDLGMPETSEPYALLKFQEPDTDRWRYRVFKVEAEGVGSDGTKWTFNYSATAGQQFFAPYPVSYLHFLQGCPDDCPENVAVSGPYWRDRKKQFWAMSAGNDGMSTATIIMRYRYAINTALIPGIYFPPGRAPDGTRAPWLDRGTGVPTNIYYEVSWPVHVKDLYVAETLGEARRGLPGMINPDGSKGHLSAEIIYQQSLTNDGVQSVKLIDPTWPYEVALDQLPSDARTQIDADSGLVHFTDLPPHLLPRFFYDPPNRKLKFKGIFVPAITGESYLLLNVITGNDLSRLLSLSTSASGDTFRQKVNQLADLAAAAREVPPNTPFKTLALTAGLGRGVGYVTIAFGNSTNLHLPGDEEPSLKVIRVSCEIYRGEIKVINASNPLEEKLTLRHSGDFAGKPDEYEFEWRTLPPINGLPPTHILYTSWGQYSTTPDTGQGALDVTIEGANIYTLSDNYFVCRYRPATPDNVICTANDGWSEWTQPMLAEGWIKRVVGRINPFTQRVSGGGLADAESKFAAYANSEIDTVVNMVSQAGRRWEGDVALNLQAVRNAGLIETYETVLKRGIDLSIEGSPALDYAPANDALLLAAGRLSDLYMLLGNEAYADASDPTIAYGTDDRQYGSVASSIHCFMNQTPSLLEEELALLRGRDDSLLPPITTPPFYNRLIWNFTRDITGGEVAYALNYNIRDENGAIDGVIDEADAKRLYPQAHGDAWGHYLTAVKYYYRLLRNTNFTWIPRIEAVLVGGVPVSVDYFDERKFATAAAARARAGAEIVDLTHRNFYQDDPDAQRQGYQDANVNRAWGLSEWGSRAGQGALFDWVTANALLPPAYQFGYRITSNTLSQVGALAAFDLTDDQITNTVAGIAGTTTNEINALLAIQPRQFEGRESFIAALESALGTNAIRYQDRLLTVAQTNGLPESLFAAFQPLAGRVFPDTNDLVVALQRAVGTNEFGEFYTPLIQPYIELPTGQQATGIQKVDRTSVPELREIASAYQEIQSQVDKADMGLNPLGVARNAVPFDIDPNGISQGKTHFEQIYDRSVQAMNNAITVFNHANNSTQLLRRQADTVQEFQDNVDEREIDFNSRLIEVFGYPYPEDIGPTGSYPSGYNGPDLLHFNYIEIGQLTGVSPPTTTSLTLNLSDVTVDDQGALQQTTRPVSFSLASGRLRLVKPPSWTGQRRAPGEIQRALGELIQSQVRFEKALVEYDNLLRDIQSRADDIDEQYEVNASEIEILNLGLATQTSLNVSIQSSRQRQLNFRNYSRYATIIADATAELLPRVVGWAFDATSTPRGVIRLIGAAASQLLNEVADRESLAELDHQQAKETAQAVSNIELTTLKTGQALDKEIAQLQQAVRQEATFRFELYSLRESMEQAAGNYNAVLARGQRLLEDRLRFRAQTAAKVQGFRYRDMAFRIFRNEALQKYRAQFDLAARYVFLAAKAYDYETSLLPGDPRGPGRDFMNEIVRSRAIGLIQDGQPLTGGFSGDGGLADPLARMSLNWSLVIKPQLGFNNPETETGRFSLRSELFRIQAGSKGKATWQQTLRGLVTTNILALPEFQRYCIPFVPVSTNGEPGIVIRFPTRIEFGQNFFEWPLGGGDSSYDSSHFATKIRSVGVWFANYNALSMAATPRVYLFPIGTDLLRSPSGFQGEPRAWNILDQLLPVPFVNPNALAQPGWIPMNEMAGGSLGDIRKFASFRAYHDSGTFTPAETTSSSRLIGRSVWNTHWMLIIPAGALLNNREEALNRFIEGSLNPVTGQRDGNGVSDIKIFFQTYSYAGN